MKNKLWLSFSILLIILMSSTQAVELRINNEHVDESNRYETDYIFIGQYLDFGGIANDLFFIGQKLNYYGQLKLGLFAGGQILNIDGPTGNGLKAAGQIINISSTITGTSFLGGQEVNCEPSSQMNGDTFVTAARAFFKGPIQGDLFVAAGEVHIENEIFGDVQIRAGQISLSKNALVHGDLIYFADQKIKPEDRDKIKGNVQFVQGHEKFMKKHMDHEKKGMPIWLTVFLKLSLALIGFIILLLPISKNLEIRAEASGIVTLFLWGLIPLLIYPTLIILLTILIIPIPLAIGLLLATFPLILVLKTISLTLIGGVIAARLRLKTTNRFLLYLIAVVIYSILSLIPFFGFVLFFFVFCVGWGVVLSWLVRKPLIKQRQENTLP